MSENHAERAPRQAPVAQPRRSRVLEELTLRLTPPILPDLNRRQQHRHGDIDLNSHAPCEPPSRSESDEPSLSDPPRPPSDVGSLNVQSATPDLAMDEDLYSSVEVTYQTCTCSAAAQARSPVAASERRSMNRRATRDVVDGLHSLF